MGLLAPWFLAGALALGVPVFVHLLRKQTTTPWPFSSLMFFERGVQSSTRHRKLRYWLLFCLRAALVALLVLAFANPFVRRANAGASGKLLLVVVDNSFSMRAATGAATTRFADAKRGALEVLAAKPGGQRAQVMALGSQLQVLTQPVQDAGTLRAAVEGIQQGDSKGNYGELGRGLRALTETVHAPVELHLFSDMQKTEMPGNFADMVLPGNVRLVLHAAGSGAPGPNWTVESVVAPAQLADPKDKRRSRVEAVVAGFETPAAAKMVSLLVNGKVVAAKRVEVPANGRAKVELEPLDVPYGFSRCEVRVSAVEGGGPDAFAADDASVFAVRRSDPERVAFIHGAGDARSALYFGAALGAVAESSFVLQPVSVEQSGDVDPTRYAFVVLSDVGTLPSILENSLTQYVKAGGSVLVAAGTSAAHLAGGRQRIPLLGMEVQEGRYYSREPGDGYAKVGQVDGTHAVMGDTGAEDAEDDAGARGWSELKVFYAVRVDAAKAGARVLVRLGDGTPLLMDKALGEGHVLVLASGLENLTNDLPLQPGFVPFVDRAARYLSGEDRLGGARVVDSFVQLRTAGAAPSGAGVEVVDPEGKRPLSLAEAGTIRSYQLTRSGFYQLRFANGRAGLTGVNPDRRESDMTVIPEDVLKLWSGSGGVGMAEGTAEAEIHSRDAPYSLWWWVMLLALVAAVAESLVAAGHLGTQREEA
jgi:hypothetical protein